MDKQRAIDEFEYYVNSLMYLLHQQTPDWISGVIKSGTIKIQFSENFYNDHGELKDNAFIITHEVEYYGNE